MKSLFIGFVFLLTIRISYAQDSSLSLSDSLMAYYPFNGNANDYSGNNNNGTVYGPVLTEDRFGNANGAYYFDGVNDYIEVKDDNTLTPTENKMSITVWAKLSYPGDRYFVYKGSTLNDREYALAVRIDSLASFHIDNLGSHNQGIWSESTIKEDQWNFIAGTWDGTQIKIYVNGQLENSTNLSVTIGNFDSDLFIGAYGGDIERYALHGAIDEIRIYNRVLSDIEISQLYSNDLYVQFKADTTSGSVPLTVNFTDLSQSSNSIKSWAWDFDGDGKVDSNDQNPEWTYQNPGLYSVNLTVEDSILTSSRTKTDYIIALSEHPVITKISDIPNDQGGWVSVNFLGSIYDTDSLKLSKTSSTEIYTVEFNDGSGWVSANSTVAYGNNYYSILVHTLMDSTWESAGKLDFRVIAGMDEGNFASNIVSGYSIDNINPTVPASIKLEPVSDGFLLEWQKSPDNDLSYYNIYRSEDPNLITSSSPYSKTSETTYSDTNIEAGHSYFYAVSAVDFSGNESGLSYIVNGSITNLTEENDLKPNKYYLDQNYPNPFNPSTVINFGVPQTSLVKITIFNILGAQIKELVNKEYAPGNYSITWNGVNKTGRHVTSGLYFYKIETSHYTKVKKMLLVK